MDDKDRMSSFRKNSKILPVLLLYSSMYVVQFVILPIFYSNHFLSAENLNALFYSTFIITSIFMYWNSDKAKSIKFGLVLYGLAVLLFAPLEKCGVCPGIFIKFYSSENRFMGTAIILILVAIIQYSIVLALKLRDYILEMLDALRVEGAKSYTITSVILHCVIAVFHCMIIPIFFEQMILDFDQSFRFYLIITTPFLFLVHEIFEYSYEESVEYEMEYRPLSTVENLRHERNMHYLYVMFPGFIAHAFVCKACHISTEIFEFIYSTFKDTFNSFLDIFDSEE